MTQPFLLADRTWVQVRDGNASGRALYRRHYRCRRYRDGRDPAKFVGPGENMVLLTPDASALFVWRKFISRDHQDGINCAVFRNEGPTLSSDLIREAMRLAWERWPGERFYTYVAQDPEHESRVLISEGRLAPLQRDEGPRVADLRSDALNEVLTPERI